MTAPAVAVFATESLDCSGVSMVLLEALATETEGMPCGFWIVITSSLRYPRLPSVRREGRRRAHSLLILDVRHQVLSTLYTLGQEDIASSSDGHYVRVLAERLERNGVVNLS